MVVSKERTFKRKFCLSNDCKIHLYSFCPFCMISSYCLILSLVSFFFFVFSSFNSTSLFLLFFPFHFSLLRCIPLLISLTFLPYVLFVEITGFPSCSETCVSMKFLSSFQIHFTVICYYKIKMPPTNKLFFFLSPELQSIFH